VCVSFATANLRLFVKSQNQISDLRGYINYEPEYTSEELDELSRAVITSSVSSHR